MKKIILSLLILTFLTLPNSSQALAQSVEIIKSFDSQIEIFENSEMEVLETIVYDFGSNQKHGIYRYIPYRYKRDDGRDWFLNIEVKKVTDDKNNNYKYRVEKDRNNINIKIGNPDVTISGIHSYKILYRVNKAINFFPTHDEFYWNVTGNEWGVTIGNATASISLPQEGITGQIQATCFTGKYGTQTQSCSSSTTKKGATFTTTQSLAAYQGLTIVFGWPKGIVHPPTLFQEFLWWLKRNAVLLLPILTLIGLLIYWRRYGRDPEGRGTIIAEYEPPQEVRPGEGGTLIDEKVDIHDITATLIDLARRGHYKIKEVEKTTLKIFKGKDWQLIKTDKELVNLNEYEQKLMEALFTTNNNTQELSKLKRNTSFAKEINKVKKEIYQKTVSNGWFPKNPNTTRVVFFGAGMLIYLLVWFLGALTDIFPINNSGLGVISFVICAFLFIGFSSVMPRKTKQGKLMQEKLLGFKMFLGTTEKDRVKFHFSPQAHPEKFAEYIPWAIVFKVEKEWAKVFAGIDIPKPDWYEGAWVGAWTAAAFSNNIGNFNSTFTSTLRSGGAASGSSGFGGGGFSGGGFGGGGGGSW